MPDRQAWLDFVRGRYVGSRELLARAARHNPLGSQTFSKSHLQAPAMAAPLFLERGAGAQVWDVDGNAYVDFVNGLLPVILGYCDPDVDAAVIAQLGRGVSFSLATRLEVELAELLAALIPCAEHVRFGKSGTDATSASIRVARASTGRDRVATCGYHGWQDWSIGATARSKGVPRAVCELTHPFVYNDLGSLERVLTTHPGEFAAVMLEPMGVVAPAPGFLEAVRELAHRHGALLVFDEVITGFRFHLGGAQALFGVTPDLAAFGKSMGNGFPISAVVGKEVYMREMDEIFYSGTFGGEAASLAASLATLAKLQREPVLETLAAHGSQILARTSALIARHGLVDVVGIAGHPARSVLAFQAAPGATLWESKSLYLQEMLARGILTNGGHNLSYAHAPADLEALFAAQDEAFGVLREALDARDVRAFLAGPPIEPLFRVR